MIGIDCHWISIEPAEHSWLSWVGCGSGTIDLRGCAWGCIDHDHQGQADVVGAGFSFFLTCD